MRAPYSLSSPRALYPSSYMPPVGLKLRFPRPAGPYGACSARGCLPHKVRPHPGKPRQYVLVLRELDLELPLLCSGPSREYVEYQAAAVDDAHFSVLLERPGLCRRQIVVEHDESSARIPRQSAHLGRLALAYERCGPARRAFEEHADAARSLAVLPARQRPHGRCVLPRPATKALRERLSRSIFSCSQIKFLQFCTSS